MSNEFWPALSAALAQHAAASKTTETANGHLLIAANHDALSYRLALIDNAQTSIALQSYLFHDDRSGHLILDALYRAALRGVQVRVLLDDIDSRAREPLFAALASHANFSLKLFHPFAGRRFPRLSRVLSLLFDLGHRGRRMHNKLFIVDDRALIIGGRNIGDDYLASALTTRTSARQFVDLDVLVIGAGVSDAVRCFDCFWRHESAIAVEQLLTFRHWPLAQRERALQRRLEHWRLQIQQLASPILSKVAKVVNVRQPRSSNTTGTTPVPPDRLAFERNWTELFAQMIWAPSQLLWDRPDKIRGLRIARNEHSPRAVSSTIAAIGSEHTSIVPSRVLFQHMLNCRHDLLLVSPYFVPGLRGFRMLKRLCKRQVRVRLLTNSLSATDVPLVHGAYERYRGLLLRAGVEIFELKARESTVNRALGEPAQAARMKTNSNATAATANRTHALRRHGLKRWHASLHAKTYVFDQHRVFVGSFNLDPRSISLNTETGILIDSSQLATQIEQLFNQACAPERSYRVQSQHLGLRWPVLHWTSQEAQRLIIYKREPHAGWARRLIALMARLLPIEAQL